MTAFFALLAAFSNAYNVAQQHAVSIAAPSGTKRWRLVRYLVTNPLWLLGEAALVAAFLFQAVALHLGELSVVQPLLVTELVFTLIIRSLWARRPVALSAWAAAGTTCVGLGVFIAMSEPQGGATTPTSVHWLSSMVICGAVIALLTGLASWGSPRRRAALYGAAAGVTWAIEASFIKAMTDTLAAYGVGGMLVRWPVYAVAVAGVAGTVLVQAALHVGPLNVSQPFIVVVDPLVAIILGIWLYRERFTSDPAEIAVAVVGFAVMVVGVLGITRATLPEVTEPGDPATAMGS